ncbi:porin [Marinobacter koreensis]|uniref:Porin n=1 Tax=Marinobacter koreensis TaxID=335974 RepID=A0ABW0RLD9_9GAMM|nr:porin [Marinobacter koreensis]MCK7549768.1 porin [Marinobacter koreensis]
MKKTLIASAIAAATFSGAALAQNTATMTADDLAARMDSMPTVYGNIQLAIVHDNFDNGPSSLDFADNGSTIGFKHDHEIAPGITGFFKAELEFDADQKAGNGGLNGFDEAYIGVKGDRFGQVWAGSDDSTYETAIDEIYNHYEYGSFIGGSYDTGEGDLVQYRSPSFGGLTVGAAVQINGDSTTGGKSYPYQLAAIYQMGGLELAFAMDSNDGSLAYSQDGKNDDPLKKASERSINNENTYGLRASYSLENLRVTGEYQTRKDVSDVYGVMGVYTMGANNFSASYQVEDYDTSESLKSDVWALQALHNLSDYMYVWVEGYMYGGDSVYAYNGRDTTGNGFNDTFDYTDQRSIAAVGAVYYF